MILISFSELNEHLIDKTTTGLMVSTDNGTIINDNIRMFYSDNAVSVNYRLRLRDVTARPNITVTNLPNNLPQFSGFGNPTLFSPTGSGGITTTDLSDISYDGNNLTIFMENFIGQIPTGYVELSGSVFYVNT